MTPTQADREAAALLYTSGLIYAGSSEGSAKVAQRILDGQEDQRSTVQMFTRHRLAAEAAAFERAAGVADEQTRLNVQARIDRADDELAFQFRGLGNVIATAIRKLAGEKHD